MSINIIPLMVDSLLMIIAGFSLVYAFDKALSKKVRIILLVTASALILVILYLTGFFLADPARLLH
ncbi:MAG: hypothetical protein PUF82_08190 [Lactobacillus equicursoris]|uniref:hypothetical protein n=1 Tax=Lactobacillus equicursoris TaxID=420645 RepID=UPI00242A4058|nr:hypothetical protein [Lactobacillus equicursoris]MDD6387268.1 hypothetical protein [Lactobacillus equicursoris]MDD6407952.1 hypothetical protein [Lactobacillus equicursoris]